MSSGPQHVISAKEDMEYQLVNLFDEAKLYTKSEGGDGSHVMTRRRALLRAARTYAASVERLTRVRKR